MVAIIVSTLFLFDIVVLVSIVMDILGWIDDKLNK